MAGDLCSHFSTEHILNPGLDKRLEMWLVEVKGLSEQEELASARKNRIFLYFFLGFKIFSLLFVPSAEERYEKHPIFLPLECNRLPHSA